MKKTWLFAMCPSSISTRYLFQKNLKDFFPTKIIQKNIIELIYVFSKTSIATQWRYARKFPYTELPYALAPWWNAKDWWIVDTPGKINGWNLRIRAPWKRRNIFQPIIFRFYVNLGGCSVFFQRCGFFSKIWVNQSICKTLVVWHLVLHAINQGCGLWM